MSDSEDDLLDYSILSKKKNNKALKRGSKNENSLDRLEAARSALFDCLKTQKRPSAKSSSQGVFSKSYPYYTNITQSKGTHLHSVGFSVKGVITLYPEEAAFLVSRSALVATDGEKDVLFEDYCEVMCTQSDGWITFDKYLVYAYLKRLGFIVMRASNTPTLPTQTKTLSCWRLLLKKMVGWHHSPASPLAWHYSHKTYASLYSTLQIIPSHPWYRPFESPAVSGMDWYVYKPRPSFSKKNPGQPDFKVIVRHVSDTLPSLDEQHQLFGQESQLVVALVGDAESITFLRMNGDDMQDISQRLHSIKPQKRPLS
ncbi:hypothetical protein BD560DRAFT_381170 [Blakeslea trispora]|nr:hypothetical protein BD560DRAFT_381170 [Blakeslea trispora]